MVLNVVGSSPTGHPKAERSFGLFFCSFLLFLELSQVAGADNAFVVKIEIPLGLAQDFDVFAKIPE